MWSVSRCVVMEGQNKTLQRRVEELEGRLELGTAKAPSREPRMASREPREERR